MIFFFPFIPYFTFVFPNKLTSGSVPWVQVSTGLACRVGPSLLREITGLDSSLIHILESPKSCSGNPPGFPKLAGIFQRHQVCDTLSSQCPC